MSIDAKIQEVRDEFPILKYKTYMNSAAHGPALRRVWDAVQECWLFRMNEDLGARQPDAKGAAAELIHASREEICWCARVTQGFNMVSSMIDIKRGENVVVTDLGYPSNVYVWLPLREKGVEIRRIENVDGRIETSDFEKVIDDKTRVVSLSHIEWTSGLRYDMKSIVDIAHEHGALVVDDAYQAVGPVDVNVHRDGVDFLLVGSEKWMCSPAFAGIFYIRKGLIDELEPTYRFYNQVEEAFSIEPPWVHPDSDNIASYDKPLYPTADKYYRGCVAESALWGFNAAMEYFNGLGGANREEKVLELSGYLIDRLRELRLKVNTPLEPKKRGGLVTYTTGRHELNVKSYQTMRDESIIVALRYQRGIGGIRVSTNFFNTEEDVDRLIEVQKRMLE
jgi:selenocysteine lyase/cysteine desulfurase